MTKSYPYLTDSDFLEQIVNQTQKEYYIKITLLNWMEERVSEIEGKVTTGNISINGNSAVRRTANITFLLQEDDADAASLFELNKKIFLQIGYDNETDSYENYSVLWFPFGVYIITNFSFNHSLSGTSVSLELKDKMCLLNGECGGVLPAATIFNSRENQDEQGNVIISYPTIFQIIMELVNHFGGEQLGNIIISDIDDRVKRVMMWIGNKPLFVLKGGGTGGYLFLTDEEDAYSRIASGNYTMQDGSPFEYGSNVGFILTDFIYPGDLIGNAGDTITSILDKIKNLLGNYEYFYDIMGHFRFQEIKNYLNNSQTKYILDSLNQGKLVPDYLTGQGQPPYLIQRNHGKPVFSFKRNNHLIISYRNAPQAINVKNDYIVWGLRKTGTNGQIPIRYHLAIDKKPQVGNTYNVVKYIDMYDGVTEKWYMPLEYDSLFNFPEKGEFGVLYYDRQLGDIYKWEEKNKLTQYILLEDVTRQPITTTDWRTELYFQGVAAQPYGLNSNFYYAELMAEWPKIYDIQNGKFRDEVIKDPSSIDYYLDFINPVTTQERRLSIDNIGRRTVVLNQNSNMNCVFEPYIPDVIIINNDYGDGSETDMSKLKDECDRKGYLYTQVSKEVYDNLVNGYGLNSGYEEIKQVLYQYVNLNENITLQTIPIYFLEVNTCIEVQDEKSFIDGTYLINSLNFSFDATSNLSINASKVLNRF